MSRNNLTETPRRRLAHQVIEQLQRWISLGDFSPGDPFPTEGELTARLGVSRTTLREAVGVLAHSGVLEVRQGDGTYVGSVAPAADPFGQRLRRAAALEVYEVRRVLELETARLAAERRTDEDVVVLRRHLAARSTARASGDAAAFVTADVALHVAIATATQNAVLADLYRSFTGTLHGAITDVVHDPALREDTSALHEALVNAIADQDAARAIEATDRLLEVDARELRGTLGRS